MLQDEESRKIDKDFFDAIGVEETGISLDDPDYANEEPEKKEVTQKIVEESKPEEKQDEKPKEEPEEKQDEKPKEEPEKKPEPTGNDNTGEASKETGNESPKPNEASESGKTTEESTKATE